ncbi:hypothetical protein [Aureibacillus halotolerans]|uniref:Uncharacterized protein n=1 Tax=Aureibacillus halotolerans TaxID=1508390 RepID=A0A4R6UAS1_9BACI|nr:hypothetical protein [Aureibacillus halotolerans]TDQ42153.1 hypothetical protein EV213_102183 [Aureibacillus halotolerans]
MWISPVPTYQYQTYAERILPEKWQPREPRVERVTLMTKSMDTDSNRRFVHSNSDVAKAVPSLQNWEREETGIGRHFDQFA